MEKKYHFMTLALTNICVVLIGVVGFFFTRDRLVNDLYRRQKLELNQLSQVVRSTFFYNHAYALSKNIARHDDDLRYALLTNSMHEKLRKKIEAVKMDIDASIIYLINKDGKTIASTRYDKNKSLIGENYAFRPYFKEAMKGNPFVYAALGVTTHLRGLYYASPVVGGKGNVLGVFVIKMDAESFDYILNRSGDIFALMTDSGHVFSSSRRGWLFTKFSEFSNSSLIKDDRRFGDIAEKSVQHFYHNEGDHFASYEGRDYILDNVQINVYNQNWTLLSLKEYDSKTHFFIFSFYGLAFVIVLFLTNGLIYSFERMKESLSEAKKANEAKGVFLANTSHEIRTPIAGIIGIIGLMEEEGGLSQNAAEKLRIINGLTLNLSQIINDILDYSKIEAGKLDIESIDFNLKNVIETTITPFIFQAGKKKIEFELFFSDLIPELINSDPNRISQIISNMLSNAIKFTNRGKVELLIDVVHIEDRRFIEFRCKDSGIGISKEAQRKLFTSFTQGDSSTSRKFGGTGLGLVITKELTRLLEGDLKFESEEGIGTTFIVRIPLKSPMGIMRILPDVVVNFKPRMFNVLLAEDNEINLTIAKRLLEKIGFTKVDVAINGAEAYEKFMNGDYDLVFMDCQMPIMSGYEATKKIRETQRGNSVIIVALTANAMVGEREKCIAAGMNDYVTKPINRNKLIALLNSLLV